MQKVYGVLIIVAFLILSLSVFISAKDLVTINCVDSKGNPTGSSVTCDKDYYKDKGENWCFSTYYTKTDCKCSYTKCAQIINPNGSPGDITTDTTGTYVEADDPYVYYPTDGIKTILNIFGFI